MIRDGKRKSHPFPGNIAAEIEAVQASEALFNPRRVLVIVIVLAVLLVAGGAIIYRIQSNRYPVVVAVGIPDDDDTSNPLGGRTGMLIPVTPDMLEVTSISLDPPKVAIVNDKELSEGQWLVVNTRLGAASVRVVLIQDGLVRFRHGGQLIDARIQASRKLKKAP